MSLGKNCFVRNTVIPIANLIHVGIFYKIIVIVLCYASFFPMHLCSRVLCSVFFLYLGYDWQVYFIYNEVGCDVQF